MVPEKCATCDSIRACINGWFCLKIKRYIEYTINPICNDE